MSNAVEARSGRGRAVAEPLVGLLRRPEARELPHRPQPPAVHARIHAARERKLARQPDARSSPAAIRSSVYSARIGSPESVVNGTSRSVCCLSSVAMSPSRVSVPGSSGTARRRRRLRCARRRVSARRRADRGHPQHRARERCAGAGGRTRLRSAARSLRASASPGATAAGDRQPARRGRPARAQNEPQVAARARGERVDRTHARGGLRPCARAVPAHADPDVAGGQRRAVTAAQAVAHAPPGRTRARPSRIVSARSSAPGVVVVPAAPPPAPSRRGRPYRRSAARAAVRPRAGRPAARRSRASCRARRRSRRAGRWARTARPRSRSRPGSSSRPARCSPGRPRRESACPARTSPGRRGPRARRVVRGAQRGPRGSPRRRSARARQQRVPSRPSAIRQLSNDPAPVQLGRL